MYYLKNGELTVEIASLGAEMKSLRITAQGWSICGEEIRLSGNGRPRCFSRWLELP